MKTIQFKFIGEALVLAIGLFLAGGAIRKGIVQFKEMDRTVTAKGLSEKEVKADKVTWPLKFKELGNDPAEIYDQIARDTRTIVDFLKANGISDDEITQAPPIMVDQQANMSYSSEQVRYRYKANCVVTVVSRNVDVVRKLVSRQAELMRQGQFSIENRDQNTPWLKNVRVVTTVVYYLKD